MNKTIRLGAKNIKDLFVIVFFVFLVFGMSYGLFNYQIFKTSEIVRLRIFLGITSFSALAICRQIYRKRSKDNSDRKLDVMIMFPLCLFLYLAFFAGLQLLNGCFDESQPEEHDVIINKMEHIGIARDSIFFIYFNYWGNPDGNCRLMVQSKFFYRANIGDKLLLETSKGVLGFEWIRTCREYISDDGSINPFF